MDQLRQSISVGIGGTVFRIILFVLSFYVLYLIYKFLFFGTGQTSYSLNSGIVDATAQNPVVIGKDLPGLTTGTDFSVQTWVYINNYTYKRGQYKSVLSIGGGQFQTLAIMLGPSKNSLHVRLHTAANNENMNTNINSLLTTVQVDGGLLNESRPCDVSQIDLQKWVLVSVVVQQKTVDVYLDGKLARSCILPDMPIFPSAVGTDGSNYSVTLLDKTGFGGFMGNTILYNYGLNPEQVWRTYMDGPGQSYSIGDYIKALFDPKAVNTLVYPSRPTA